MMIIAVMHGICINLIIPMCKLSSSLLAERSDYKDIILVGSLVSSRAFFFCFDLVKALFYTVFTTTYICL